MSTILRKCSALFLFFIISCFTILYVSTGYCRNQPNILISHCTANDKIRYIRTILKGSLSLKNDAVFSIKAYVEPVMFKMQRINKEKIFDLTENKFACINVPCTKNITFDIYDQNFHVSNYSHFMLVWDNSLSNPSPEISVKAEIEIEGEDKPLYIYGFSDSSKKNKQIPILTLDFNNASFTEKKLEYVAKRKMGYKSDKKWRYTQEGQFLILQKRVDLPLKNIQFVQVVMEKNIQFERIQFSVDSTGNGSNDMFILFDQTIHKTVDEKGMKILTIDMETAVKKLKIDKNKAILQEPILFLPIKIGTFISQKPIRSVIFSGSRTKFKKNISAKIKRYMLYNHLIFDFSQEIENQRAKYKKITVKVHSDLPQFLSWQKMSLCEPFSTSCPEIIKLPLKALKTWKGVKTNFNPDTVVTSFRPVMRISKKKKQNIPVVEPISDKSIQKNYSTGDYKDNDIEISTSQCLYDLSKNSKTIIMKGILTDQKSHIRLKINPCKYLSYLSFTSNELNQIILESLNNKPINLPLNIFLEDNKLLIPKESEITILLQSDNKQQNEFETQLYSKQQNEFNPQSYNKQQNKFGTQLYSKQQNEFKPQSYNKQQNKFEPPNIFKSDKREKEFSAKKWHLEITAQKENRFGSKNVPLKKIEDKNYNIWFAQNSKIKGSVYPYFSSMEPFEGNLIISSDGIIKNIPISLFKNLDNLHFPNTGIRMLGFTQSKNDTNKNEKIDIIFFDAEEQNISGHVNLKDYSWWVKNDSVKFISDNDSIEIDQKNKKAYLFCTKANQARWLLQLDDTGFMPPASLIFPGPVPKSCKATLLINEKEVPIKNDQKIIKIKKLNPHENKILVKVEYSGYEPFIVFPLPELKVYAAQKKMKDKIKGLAILINEKKLPVVLSNLLESSGKWITAGNIALEQGNNFIKVLNNPYFKIKTILLETKNIIAFPESEINQTPHHSLWKKLLSKVFKLAIIIILIGMLYFFRSTIKSRIDLAYKSTHFFLMKIYGFFPKETWAMLWFGLILFLFIMVSINGYGKTYGTLCMVIFVIHITQRSKSFLFKNMPKLAELVCNTKSSICFAWAVVLLFLTAILVSLKMNDAAEYFAIIVYYLMVTGVIFEIYRFIKKNNNRQT